MSRVGEPGDESGEPAAADRRAISSSERAQLRRWELGPETAADLAARAVGLSAPVAPPAGALAPNGTGWLIGPGEFRGQTAEKYERAKYAAAIAYVVGVPNLAREVFHVRPFLSPLLVAIPIPIILLDAFIRPRLLARRQLKRAERAARVGDVPDGTLVRVTGTIAPGTSVPTLFRGVPAVLFRNRIAPADETRGLDFFLDLDEGARASVSVRRAFLLDALTRTREPPACGPVSARAVGRRAELRSDLFERSRLSSFGRYESSVGPGDRVEVCGVVRHVPAPDLQSGFLRVPPLRHVLAAGEELPLLVRRV